MHNQLSLLTECMYVLYVLLRNVCVYGCVYVKNRLKRIESESHILTWKYRYCVVIVISGEIHANA